MTITTKLLCLWLFLGMSKYHVCGAVLCCGSCTPPHSGSSNAWAGETNIAKTPMNQPNLHDHLSYHWSCGQKSVASRCCFNRAWYWVSHNAFFGNPRHTQSTIVYMILSISGNSSEELHCENVVNMPYCWESSALELQNQSAMNTQKVYSNLKLAYTLLC